MYPSFKKKKNHLENLRKWWLFLRIALTNTKQPKGFFVHCSIMKIFATCLFPWKVFSLSCRCPLSLSSPPFLLHIHSGGHGHSKECFPFQSTLLLSMFITLLACSSCFSLAPLIFALLIARWSWLLSDSNLKEERRKRRWTQRQNQTWFSLF